MPTKCTMFRLISTARNINIGVRNLSISSAFNVKRPRVLPVCHQVLADHNSQYFTSYPYLKKEDLEEPPPPVDDVVRELLINSRPKFIGPKWIPAKIQPWQFRKRRKELIAAGHYFPDLPMRDRMLDPMPMVQQQVIKREDRWKRIEENMKMMPQWIAEYKEKRRMEVEKKKEDKQKQRLMNLQMKKLGLHPKDPRAKLVMEGKLAEAAAAASGKSEPAKRVRKFSHLQKKNKKEI